MTKPETQCLYVMQNEFGLIKIGRSVNPELRRKSLQSGERCAIKVVAVLDGEGHKEEAIHIALQEHAIEGEWFDGTSASRAAIVELIPRLQSCDWPFEHNQDGAAAWLGAFYGRRDQRSIERLYQRILKVHLQRARPGPDADGAVCHLVSIIEHGEMASLSHDRLKGKDVVYVYGPGRRERRFAPPYTTDLGTALDLWPDAIRPTTWEGTAYECAIAAMVTRYDEVRYGPPQT